MKGLWAALFEIAATADFPAAPNVPSGIGALRFDSTTKSLQYWNGSVWADVAGNGGKVNTGVTASTTQTRAGATQLTGAYNNITTCANASDAVGLPDIVFIGQQVWVTNAGANAAKVFPSSATGGASTTIDGGSAAASVTLTNAKSALFTATTLTNWQSIGSAARAA